MLIVVSVGCGQEGPEEEIETVTSALNVGSMSQLAAMGTTGSYVLTANLNATGTTWTPKTFSGTFDGGNHTISNLTINVSNGFNAGFFTTMLNATVRRVRFINLKVTGNSAAFVGGLAGWSDNSLVEDVGVEVTVTANGASTAGGIFGQMYGGTLNRSYAKGSVNSSTLYAGGLVGAADLSNGSGALINQCYAAVTVAPTTSGSVVFSGGIVGWAFGAFITEVYAVGNVTGRASVGGLVGAMDCSDVNLFVFNHGIYRGNVTDMNRPPPAGWAGVIGGANENCIGRFDQFWWDNGLDGSTASYISPNVDPNHPIQRGASSADLKSPTTASGGVYNWDDNNLSSAIWSAGTTQQHHALVGMPGGLSIQPRL
jgi:hypothetical protein